jgi:adhesin/invasin
MLASGRLSQLSSKALVAFAAFAFAAVVHGCGDGGGDLCNGPLCVPLPPESQQPAHLRPGAGNSQNGAPGRELALPLDVIVTDNKDRPVPGVMVTFAVTAGGGSLSSEAAESDNQGRAQVSWTLGSEVGAQGVQATATDGAGAPLEGSPLALSAEAIQPPAASILLRTAPPDTASNGVPLEEQPVVQVLDSDGQPVPGAQVVASVATGSATLSGTTTLSTDAAGQATYSDLALTGPPGTNSIRFRTEPAVEISAGPIELIAGTPAAMRAAGPLTFETTVSSPVSPSPSVVVTDASGNPVPGVAVTFDPNRDATVSPETATTDAGGLAQVSWTLGRTANVQYTLTTRIDGSPIPAIRFSATALPGTAGRLRVAVQPSSPTQNGSAFAQQPEIQVLDQNGNPTPQPGLVITASVSSGPTGSLQNASATTNAEGRAVFSGLTLTGAVGNYTVSFSAPGITGVTSLPTTITVGPATRLAFAVLPSTAARSRAPLVIQPVLQVQDQSANPVAQGGTSVVVSTSADRTTLSGETAITDENGRAVFTSLTITGPPGPKPLTFSAPPLQSASASVRLPTVQTVTVASSHPATAVAGSVLPSPTSWTLVDNSARPVPDADFTLSASSGGALSPSGTTSDLNGKVQLDSWTLGTAAGEQFVELKLPDGRAFRDSILVTADVPVSLRLVSGDNQSAPINSELPELLVVQVVDRFNNGVENVTVQWSTCDGTPGPAVPTDAGGLSSTRQPTGQQPSGAEPFCARASVDGLAGSPVEFHYTVTGAASGITEP